MAEQVCEAASPLFDYEEAAPLAPVQPPSGDLKQVRLKAGYTLVELAKEIGVSTSTISAWDSGKPSSGPKWRAFCRRMNTWADPASAAARAPPHPPPAPRPPAAPALLAPPAPVPASWTLQVPAPRVTVTDRAALGPAPGCVAVLSADEGTLRVDLPDGRSAPCSLEDLADLPRWAAAAGLTPWRYRRPHGGTVDPKVSPRPPLVALTATAVRHLRLPDTCRGADLAHAQDLLARAGHLHAHRPNTALAWPLLRHGATGLQLALLPWDPDSPFRLPDATGHDTARLLGRYADLVISPSGPPAECAVQLMRTLRPALDTHPHDYAPHALDATGPHAWWRTPDRVEARTCTQVIALALNMPLASEGNNVRFSRTPLSHHHYPDFHQDRAGRWLVDLADLKTDPKLPSPLAADGSHRTGPAWYPAATAGFAADWSSAVRPIEAWLHDTASDRYLTLWYQQLREAHKAVMHTLGVDTIEDPAELAATLSLLPQRIDPHHRALMAAITSTEASLLDPQPVPQPPAWLPYVRTELAALARAKLYPKLLHTHKAAACYPLAVTPHLLLFCAPTDDVFQIVPRHRSPQAGMALHLGVGLGRVRPVGTAPLDTYLDLITGLDPQDPAAADRLRGILPADAVA